MRYWFDLARRNWPNNRPDAIADIAVYGHRLTHLQILSLVVAADGQRCEIRRDSPCDFGLPASSSFLMASLSLME
jgi:hypothetical protein